MDIDDNDLLSTNKYISQPVVDVEHDTQRNEEFVKYYEADVQKKEANKLRESLDRFSLRSIELDEDTDGSSLMMTNKFVKQNVQNNEDVRRYKKTIKTFVNIDSRDRDKKLYPKPNNFKIFLGKTFYNVKTIRLSSVEFPNVNAVINSTNNKIYWRNKQDIDDNIIDSVTGTYPVYSVDLRVGSYISRSIQQEISDKVSQIKRKNNLPNSDYHYFTVDLDIDTDVVTFTSLTLTQLSNNPLMIVGSLNNIVVTTPSPHGFDIGSTYSLLLTGAKALGGITATVLNTVHSMTVISATELQFETNVDGNELGVSGGGNVVKLGTLAPFQFMFGEYPNTVAPNLGFPLENSSQRVDNYIKSVENFYQIKIVTITPHGFDKSFTYIGQPCQISGSSTSPNIDGSSVVITGILDATSLLVSVNNDSLAVTSVNSGTLTFGSKTLDIASITNYTIETLRVTTFVDHNYTPSNINNKITFYNTNTVPMLGTSTIFGVLPDNSPHTSPALIVPGKVLVDGLYVVPGEGGSTSHHKPLQANVYSITGIDVGSPITTFHCINNFDVGDFVRFYNVNTVPSVMDVSNGIHQVVGCTSTTFSINFASTSFDTVSITNGTAVVGRDELQVTIPAHGFNKIVSIVQTSFVFPYTVEITTQINHGLYDGQIIRLSQTNSTPNVDDAYEVTVVDNDTFTIETQSPLSSSGTSGIIGMNHEFFLYGVTDVGGLSTSVLNGKKFVVRDIIDENTITFATNNNFVAFSERGGGSNVYISSLLHGYNGQQTNTKNDVLHRSINLEGENYVFLCCPQLATMMNTGIVKNIFARITLDQSPGTMVFSYLSNPKEFDQIPLNNLNELEFSIINYDNTLYEFNDLDYSFVLEIVEEIDTTDSFGESSRRGITNL